MVARVSRDLNPSESPSSASRIHLITVTMGVNTSVVRRLFMAFGSLKAFISKVREASGVRGGMFQRVDTCLNSFDPSSYDEIIY